MGLDILSEAFSCQIQKGDAAVVVVVVAVAVVWLNPGQISALQLFQVNPKKLFYDVDLLTV